MKISDVPTIRFESIRNKGWSVVSVNISSLCYIRNLNSGGGMGSGGMSRFGNQTYGLSPQFLDSLGIDGPLHNRLFVANLAYSVDEKKLREVFRLAGRVVTAELNRDKVD